MTMCVIREGLFVAVSRHGKVRYEGYGVPGHKRQCKTMEMEMIDTVKRRLVKTKSVSKNISGQMLHELVSKKTMKTSSLTYEWFEVRLSAGVLVPHLACDSLLKPHTDFLLDIVTEWLCIKQNICSEWTNPKSSLHLFSGGLSQLGRVLLEWPSSAYMSVFFLFLTIVNIS